MARSITEYKRNKILNNYNNMCAHCNYPGYLELHHILPVRDGGTDAYDNLIPLCEVCHAKAHGHRKKNFIDPKRKQWLPTIG